MQIYGVPLELHVERKSFGGGWYTRFYVNGAGVGLSYFKPSSTTSPEYQRMFIGEQHMHLNDHVYWSAAVVDSVSTINYAPALQPFC